MQQKMPELSDKLIQYQLRAKDVLADAFLSGEQQMILPKDFPTALRMLADAEEKKMVLLAENSSLQEKVAELKPRAEYCDVVLSCKELVPISIIAKDYGWSAQKMNKFLCEQHVQYKQGDIWLLYQEHAENGYTGTKTYNYSDTAGNTHSKVRTCWTQKGRMFLYKLLKSDGILPLIETQIA